MTDEQIKQNAEAYADKKAETVANFQRNPVVEDFIAGAHSRDEEVEERKSRYRRIEKSLRCIIDGQIEELDKLRNPWISVEDRLPEEPFSVGSNRSKDVYVRTAKGCNYIASYNFNRKDWIIVKDGYVELTNDNVIKWMPIPN